MPAEIAIKHALIVADGDAAEAKDGLLIIEAIMQAQMDDTAEAAQFLEWERQADYYGARSGEKGIGDDETNRLVDKHHEFAGPIMTTPSQGITAAKVKLRLMLRHARDDLDDGAVQAFKSILAAFGGGAQRWARFTIIRSPRSCLYATDWPWPSRAP